MSDEKEENKLFPLVPRKTPVVDLIREKMNVQPEEGIDSTPQTFGEDFIKGLATSFGIKPSAISYDMIAQWIMDWNSLMSSELLDKTGQAMGQTLGKIVSQALPSRRTGSIIEKITEKRTERPEKEYSQDISLAG